jgi:capsular exopolysaccharide synthesis family protein
VANAYVRDQVDTKAQTARQASEWLEERISQLRTQLNAATHKVQEFRLRHDYRIARNPQQPNDGTDAAPQHTLEELETSAESYRKIYESYLQAFAAVVQRQSFPVADARIITYATRPLTKSGPRTKFILALAAMVGVMAGVGIGLVQFTLDYTIRSAQQVRDELGLDYLGMIPRSSARRRTGLYDEVARAPFSSFSNGLKSIKAAIGLAGRAKSIRCIGFTSTLPKEGKSTLASNVATLFSMSGARTLVIDADLYRSTLTKRFAPLSTAGLIEALQEPNIDSLKQLIVRQHAADFDFLPAVPQPIVNSVDLLGSHKIQAVLQALYQLYDIILVDLPPLGPVVDAVAIGPHLDGVVIVAEWGRTTIDAVAELSRALRASKTSIIGVAINKGDTGAMSSYGRYDSVYYR